MTISVLVISYIACIAIVSICHELVYNLGNAQIGSLMFSVSCFLQTKNSYFSHPSIDYVDMITDFHYKRHLLLKMINRLSYL